MTTRVVPMPAKSFDHLAQAYAPLERLTFGRALDRARFCYIKRLENARKVLLLGEGDGRFLEQLVALFPEVEVDVIDNSPRMLERARNRVRSNNRIRFAQADARYFYPEQGYDAVVTCFFLDCFEEEALASLIPRLAACLADGGLWLYSDFQYRSGLWNLRNRLWIGILYRAFLAITDISAKRLIDPRPWFEANALTCVARSTTSAGLLSSELWQRRQTEATRQNQKPSQGLGGCINGGFNCQAFSRVG